MVLDALSVIICPHSKKTVFHQIKDIVRGGLFNDIHRTSRAGKTNVFPVIPSNGFPHASNVRGIEHAEKEAQEVAEGCNRLIRNSIICWNYLYLTRQPEAARTPEARENILKTIALHSPQAWWYINMPGEYDLPNEELQDNTGVLPPKSAPSIIPENWEPPKR